MGQGQDLSPQLARTGAKKEWGNLKPKDLCGIPWRVALALQADGWWLRSDIIWSKPNPMPESLNGWRWEQHRVKVKNSEHATKHDIRGGHKKMLEDASVHQGMSPEFLAEWLDCPGCPACEPNDGLVLRRGSWRPTKSHEYLFMLAKSDRYFADADAVREAHKEPWRSTGKPDRKANTGQGTSITTSAGRKKGGMNDYISERGVNYNPAGRNRRSVWQIATAPYSGSHFATFPPALVEPCIKAATSEHGCCPNCGSGWARVVDRTSGRDISWRQSQGATDKHTGRIEQGLSSNKSGFNKGDKALYYDNAPRNTTLGWRPTCDCGLDDTVPSLVLDPFCGSGTTLLVARELGRRGVGCDLSLPYLRDQARKRLGLDKLAAWQNGGKAEVETKLKGLPMFEETR